jgi:uncharacterized protein
MASATPLSPPRSPTSLRHERALRRYLQRNTSALIALSGGVDSTLLAFLAAQELGPRAHAATGVSDSLPSDALVSIRALCQSFGLTLSEVTTSELSNQRYTSNAPDRCFHCKDELYSQLRHLADNLDLPTIIDGTHQGDLQGHRPGYAAGKEWGVKSPFIDLSMGKEDIRELARDLALPNAQKPSSPCLSSRIAYGVPVTKTRLKRVEESERFLRSLGFKRVRVRLHDSIARIEVPPAQLPALAQKAPLIHDALRKLGFTYVTLDLGGYRSGSLLEVIGAPTAP